MEDFREIGDYVILRKIGEGAFGKVYLVENKKNNALFALKIIDKSLKNRELKAFEKFKNLAKNNNIIEILDNGFIEENFYYLMPLADALESEFSFAPDDFRWQEKSLYKEIIRRLENPAISYFSVDEILKITSDIFDAVIALSENGLVHRDIKPENILFVNGTATLSDFGLLEFDRKSVSRVGTPLYFAPSWYINKGGNPDVYGLAMTFYTLITANLPDTIGRIAYRFPEKIKGNISKDLEEQYLHWHRVILRAIAENPADRYVQIKDFKAAVFAKDFEVSRITKKEYFHLESNARYWKVFLAICLIFALVFFIFYIRSKPSVMPSIDNTQELAFDKVLYENIEQNGFKQDSFFILSKAEWTRQKQEILNSLKEDLALAEKDNRLALNSQNIKEVDLHNINSFQGSVNKLNALKEGIAITQRYLENEGEYAKYAKAEYAKINSILNDLEKK